MAHARHWPIFCAALLVLVVEALRRPALDLRRRSSLAFLWLPPPPGSFRASRA
jgi:hypothetical protein